MSTRQWIGSAAIGLLLFGLGLTPADWTFWVVLIGGNVLNAVEVRRGHGVEA